MPSPVNIVRGKIRSGSLVSSTMLTESSNPTIEKKAIVVATVTAATSSLTQITAAINTVNSNRATFGSYMSRFDFRSQNLDTQIENIDAAKSALLDTDVAAEMTKFTSAQVLMQANVAMLAQANQLPQNLLRLLN